MTRRDFGRIQPGDRVIFILGRSFSMRGTVIEKDHHTVTIKYDDGLHGCYIAKGVRFIRLPR
jgi:hypothetical protein